MSNEDFHMRVFRAFLILCGVVLMYVIFAHLTVLFVDQYKLEHGITNEAKKSDRLAN